MSAYDDRISNLLDHLKDARDEPGRLDDSAWSSRDARRRLEGILAYAEIALATADPELVSDSAVKSILAAFLQIANNPSSAAQNADAYGSAVLDAVVALPSTRGRDVAQAVKDAAANFQRSAQHRLNALSKDLDATKAVFETARADLAQQQTDFATRVQATEAHLETEIADRTSTFEARFSELHAQAADEQAALSAYEPRKRQRSKRLRSSAGPQPRMHSMRLRRLFELRSTALRLR